MVSHKSRITYDNGWRGSYKTSGLGFTVGCMLVQCTTVLWKYADFTDRVKAYS